MGVTDGAASVAKTVTDWFKSAPKPLQWVAYALALAVGYLAFAKWAELPPFTAGTTRVSIGDLIQYQQTMSHADQTPSIDQTFYDDARGKTRVRLYDSDLAMQVIRSAPGARTISVWIPVPVPDRLVTEQAPVSIGSPAWAVGTSGYRQAVAHGEADKTWKEPTGEPYVWRVYLFWNDDCTGYMIFYEASNSFLLDENGDPAFFWLKYQH